MVTLSVENKAPLPLCVVPLFPSRRVARFVDADRGAGMMARHFNHPPRAVQEQSFREKSYR
ncbi:MAG: hypothetical protein ACI9JL_003260 [Paracoccaceae bacterium]|jgi:hypothetical protein